MNCFNKKHKCTNIVSTESTGLIPKQLTGIKLQTSKSDNKIVQSKTKLSDFVRYHINKDCIRVAKYLQRSHIIT